MPRLASVDQWRGPREPCYANAWEEPDIQWGERLGADAFGAVWSATYRGYSMAVKVMEHVDQQSKGERAAFEALLMLHVRRPGLLSVYVWEDYQQAGCVNVALVMPLMAFDLNQYLKELRRRGYSEAVVLRQALLVLERVAGALAELHRLRICHLDMKPGNVVLAVESDDILDITDVQLADFGLILPAARDGGMQPGGDQGTVRFMAPEQKREGDSSYGTPSDIYAAGVSHLAVCPSGTFCMGEALHHSRLRAAFSALGDTAADALAALTVVCLEVDPALRPTAAGLQARLQDVLAILDAEEAS